MPTATLTVREVKNKETGLDISIPNYKETPGLLGSTVTRKYPDFEQLYNQVGAQFPGTILPPLPKKVLRLTETVIKDRKSKLEGFLKFLACTPKLATCSKLLEFLGVNAIKAGRYRKGEIGETEQKVEREEKPEDEEEDVTTATDEDMFGEEEYQEQEDMFGRGDEQDIFSTALDHPDSGAGFITGGEARLFEEQDLGGGVVEGDDEELLGFLPDARTPDKTVTMVTQDQGEEDSSDLLHIDDDLDKFLVLETKKPETTEEVLLKDMNTESKSLADTKPTLSPKPKPELPQKPALAQKPKLPGKKPTLPKKPSMEQKAGEEDQTSRQHDNTVAKGDNPMQALANDDILKYIQDNASSADSDLDLFS
ncbi:HCLS1-binding protein 3-like isoform X2 [Liolophura sinensis]|uniref:HCLS1-binding protein 3-like isoform X2 n=1 Tax=Liolophura sinensis TaxID=3198878 RepID=UPI0031580607